MVDGIGGGIGTMGTVGRDGGVDGVDRVFGKEELRGVCAAVGSAVIGGAKTEMDVRGAALIPAGNDGGESDEAGGICKLVAA